MLTRSTNKKAAYAQATGIQSARLGEAPQRVKIYAAILVTICSRNLNLDIELKYIHYLK